MTVQNVSEALSSVQIIYGPSFQQSVVRHAAIMEPPTQQNLFDPPPDRSQVVADSHLSSAYLPIYRVQLVHEAALVAPRTHIRSSADAVALLRQFLGMVDREHFVVIMIDRKNRLIGINTVSIGSLTAQCGSSERSDEARYPQQRRRPHLRSQPPQWRPTAKLRGSRPY
jgi:hypothetical protein